MAHYDTRVQPPAAFAEIQIANPDNGRAATRHATLDTGASRSVYRVMW